ncbi:MAG TPA: SMP-30/gluconolactonase/LRE family protein [Acidimicrobiales bacterium]|jgi:gluconolactonase|nr:SMP-30/gluconolactonase/LRE family protein [Acidimicrobiales bacterium]
MKQITSGLRFPEGPIAMDDGSVLVVEIEGGALTRVAADGQRTVVAQCGGGPNGAAVGPDGAAYVCNDGGLDFRTEDGIRFPYALAADNRGGRIQRVELATGACEDVYTRSGEQPLGALNDIVFDHRGWFYAVDTGAGAIHYANPDGSSIRPVATSLEVPNGMGLSPDGRRLYVSETYTGRVYAWDVVDDGELHNRVLLHTAEGHGWDGLAIDGAGNICIANLEHSGISIIGADGALREEVTVPVHDPYVTNVCFGGPDLRTAFITSSGRGVLYAVDWPYPGLRLNFAR